MLCSHNPPCPDAADARCCTAHVVADRFEQGWCRLCNGIIVFDDGFYLAPDGRARPILARSA